VQDEDCKKNSEHKILFIHILFPKIVPIINNNIIIYM